MPLRTRRRSSSGLLLLLALAAFAFFGPDWPFAAEERHIPLTFSDEDLQSLAQNLRITDVPRFDPLSKQAAALGRELFSDLRFSESGAIACATCHQEGRDFTDGRPLAVGLAPLARHTPTLINSYASHWFFWDGRADSLTAQVQGPLEASDEHGFDRGRVAQLLFRHYRGTYESLFGPFPPSLSAELGRSEPFRAQPAAPSLELPLSIAHYALATIRDDSLQVGWIQAGANAGLAPQRHLARAYWTQAGRSEAMRTYEELDPLKKTELDRIFARFSWSLAQYQRGLIARRSAFDAFAARLATLAPESQASEAYGEGFAEEEWRGFRIFMEAGCASCHSGPHFSDQEFHNIGLAQRGPRLDLGRAAGLLQLKADRLNCEGLGLLMETPEDISSDSCQSLPYLRTDSQELVGAFKTPTLRNVARTAPYMHDGRFASLSEVLAFYNELGEEAAVGHREETLKPLRLEPDQLKALEAFLRSLSSPLEDLSQEEKSKN